MVPQAMFENVYAKDRIRLTLSMPYAAVIHASQMLGYLGSMRKATTQWYIAPLVYSGLAKSRTIRLRNGNAFELTRNSINKLISIGQSDESHFERVKGLGLVRSGNTASFTVRGVKVRVDAASVAAAVGDLSSDEHAVADFNGKVVVDAGAYMGETALLYSILGAKKVYAFEPVKPLYETMKRNIELNRLESRIIPFMALLVGDKKEYSPSNSSFGSSEGKMIQLGEFAARMKLKDCIIKMDCEGGEYEIIRNTSSEILRRFSLLHIEYHYGYRDIVERLKAEGFEVRYSEPRIMIVGNFTGTKYAGEIVAYRKQQGGGNRAKRRH